MRGVADLRRPEGVREQALLLRDTRRGNSARQGVQRGRAGVRARDPHPEEGSAQAYGARDSRLVSTSGARDSSLVSTAGAGV